MVTRTPTYEEQLAAALQGMGLGPEGPAGLVRLGSNVDKGSGSRASSVPSSAYDPVGAMGGLFAPALIRGDPTAEAAFQRWMAANLKTPPAPNANYVPSPVVTQQAQQSPDQSRRDAIASLLLERSPGGMQGTGYPLGVVDNPDPTPENAPQENTTAPDTTTAPPAFAPDKPDVTPPQEAPQKGEPPALSNPADKNALDEEADVQDAPTPAPAPAPAHQATLSAQDMATLAQQALDNPVAFSPIGPPAPHTAPDPNLTDPYGPVDPQTAVQEQAQHALDAVLGPPPAPQTSVTKGEPTAEQDAAALAAANATAIAQGYMSPEGVPSPNTTVSSVSQSEANQAAANEAAANAAAANANAPSTAVSMGAPVGAPSSAHGITGVQEGPPSNVSSNLAAIAMATPTAVADPNNPFGDPTAVTAPAPAPAPTAPAAPAAPTSQAPSPTAAQMADAAAAIAQGKGWTIASVPQAVPNVDQPTFDQMQALQDQAQVDEAISQSVANAIDDMGPAPSPQASVQATVAAEAAQAQAQAQADANSAVGLSAAVNGPDTSNVAEGLQGNEADAAVNAAVSQGLEGAINATALGYADAPSPEGMSPSEAAAAAAAAGVTGAE